MSARTDLLAYLADLRASGRAVPCQQVDPSDRGLWTSDDPEERAFAARLCTGCSGVRACAEYGRAHPREHGVYGGLTTTDRAPHRRRRPQNEMTKEDVA